MSPPLQPATDANCKFSVCQPGSSVATALSEGESKTKHCYLLEVQGEEYRLVKQALETVRPFVFESVRTHDCTVLRCALSQGLSVEIHYQGLVLRYNSQARTCHPISRVLVAMFTQRSLFMCLVWRTTSPSLYPVRILKDLPKFAFESNDSRRVSRNSIPDWLPTQRRITTPVTSNINQSAPVLRQ